LQKEKAMRNLPVLRLGVVLAALMLAPPSQADRVQPSTARPVLVELFTSQGCNSCPPADALLGKLAQRQGVVALAWHVDYWDGLGWKDRFSSAEATARQYDYARRLGRDGIYTPQLVIDGAAETVGSDEAAASQAIAQAAARGGQGPSIALSTDRMQVDLGEAPEAAATVWLIGYDPEQTTAVGRGENAGRSLTEYQIVRRAVRLGSWLGGAASFDLPAKEGAAELIVVQPDRSGPMLAIGRIDR
jgi:hypothetical protein